MTHLVVVTGGSAGFGRAILQEAPAGATLVDVSRSGPGLPGTRHVRADLADPATWSGTVAAITRQLAEQSWGRVTVVLNAAAMNPVGLAARVDPEAYTRQVLLDSAAPQVLGQRLLAALEEVDGRRELVLVSSGATATASPGRSAYNAGKAAVDSWVRTVAAEQPEGGGTRVLAVAPGLLDTAIQALLRNSDPRDFPRAAHFRAAYEAGRLAAPNDVARRLWRLLDDGSAGTGATTDLSLATAAPGGSLAATEGSVR